MTFKRTELKGLFTDTLSWLMNSSFHWEENCVQRILQIIHSNCDTASGKMQSIGGFRGQVQSKFNQIYWTLFIEV